MKIINFIRDSIAWTDYEQKSKIKKLKFWLTFPYVYAISAYLRWNKHWK